MKFVIILYLCFILISNLLAQKETIKITIYDGIFIVGYVNQGGFLNFTGPNINFVKGNSKFILGMLPSLRFKEDKSIPKNSFIFPSLGTGFTYCYKLWAFQIPFYYNPKTSTQNGQWNIGLGIGLKMNEFNKKN